MTERSQGQRPSLPAGPYLVVGLARSGAALARLLAERGEIVLGADTAAPEEARRLAEAGVEVHTHDDGVELLDRVSVLAKSPGVPQEAPVVAAARERGMPVLGELELAWRLLPNRFVAVTGTNGKTTVTEMIGHVLETAREPVAVAGNVGTPLASLVGELDPDATVVCECSSFQLEDAEAFAPECAVLLNIAPDHLDRHRTMRAYLAAKLRIFANQGPDDVAVLRGGAESYGAEEWRDAPAGAARLVAYCDGGGRVGHAPGSGARGPQSLDEREECDVALAAGVIHWRGRPLLPADELKPIGRHNVDNAMAAAAAALSIGVDPDAVRGGLASFDPGPHRIERVAEIGGVTYVNDSKATNPAAAAAAIRSFQAPIRVILGGSLKGGEFSELIQPVAERCVAAYLIGEAADAIERELREAGETHEGMGRVAIQRLPDLEGAVAAAWQEAGPGDVVLLAPACASFDAFPDYEARGNRFRELVRGLR